MPNGNGFPQFPTAFTEKEQTRLKELGEQRKTLEEIYQAKFAPEQWAKTSLPEKAVREVLPSWLSPVVRAITPWEKGAWDYGFTPEQVQDYRFKMEEEYKELARQEKVTRLLPNIQADLMISALLGEPITDLTELISDFPELKTDFTEEEIGYLSTLAQNLLHASPEDILSGKVFGYDPSQLPISAEDIEAFAKETPGLDPRFILSSVAFSKDLQEIGAALQQAYPATVEEPEVDEGLREKLLEYFKQRAIELGITPKEGEPLQETIKKVHAKIAEDEGSLLMLSNDETGALTVVRKKADSSLWFGEELIGHLVDGKVVPFNPLTSQPLVTEEAQESVAKDLWDSFYLGMQQAWYGTRQAMLGVVPSALLSQFKKFEEWTLTHRVDKDVAEQNIKAAEEMMATLKAGQEVREAEFQEWLGKHPELAPRPEYTQNPIEHTELFKDPYFYAYTIISNAPIIGAALAVGVSTAVLTRNPLAGAAAGAALITPVQINSVYEDLIANGASPENASELATSVGTAMGAVEIIPGMIVLKAVSPLFMKVFRQNLQKELTKQVVKQLSVKGMLATAGKIEIAETLEEVIQESMQNAAVQTVNENRDLFENVPHVAVNAAISIAPLALFGGGAQYMSMKSHLPKDTQDELDTTTKKLVDAGLSQEHAEAAAYGKLVETEKGQAEVEVAMEKAEAEIPLGEELAVVSEKIASWWDNLTDAERIVVATLTKGARPQTIDVPAEVASMKWAELSGEARNSISKTIPALDASTINLEAVLMRKQIPVAEAISPKIQRLESTLVDVNEDIDIFTASIPAQEERLAKMKAGGELPSEQMAQMGKIEDLQRTLKELQDRRTGLLTMIKKLNKAAAPKPTLPAPEVIETGKEYTAVVYRGTKEGVAPVDEGLLGKGTYYTSNHEYAETYGTVATSTVTLKNPFVVKTEAEAQELWDITREAREDVIIQGGTIQEADEFAAKRIREVIEGKGYDGIIAQNLITKGEEIVVFYPEKSVTEAEAVAAPLPPEPPVPEAMPEELIVPDPNLGRELLPDGRPRLKDWVDDQEDTLKAVQDNKAISNHIVLEKDIIKAASEAKAAWEGADADGRKALVREADLRKNTIAKSWDDMSPPEQQALALATIPYKSITFSVKREVFDIRYYMQFLEEKTGLPFYSVFKRAELSHGAARIAQEHFLRRIGEDPNFTHIRSDEAALARVTQEVNARNPALKLDHPEGLSDQELLLANVIEELYKQYEPKVRYLRFMRVAPNLASMKEAFPEAPEAELDFALKIREMGNLGDLYSALEGFNWGIINSGYDPWMISVPTLVPPRVTLGSTRGAARLMRRETVDFPEGMEKNILLRLATYMKQLEAQWRIEPELDALEGLWSQAGDKINNAGQVESALREWTRELQGIPTRQSYLDTVLRRVWRQAMSAVFLHPWMAFRNFHQHLAFHPDRTEILRLITDKPPVVMKEKMDIYFESFVSQLKGIRRDWLYMGERGLPGLGWLTRLSDAMSLYSHSDNIPRRWSFQSSANKAYRATMQYRKDGDVSKWIKNSGAVHLRQTERNYALQLLAQDNFDLAVPGLKDVNGSEMASLYVGHEVANMTHFIYERAFRAPVEMGATGRTLYNLIVFPRGYFQRIYFQAKKLPNLKELFSPEMEWEQARAGFKDLMLLTIVGIMVSEWIRKVTGRPRRAYNPADIVQWQLGGLIIGVGMDLTKLISDTIVALDPTVDPEHKRDVLGRLPGELVRQADVLVPFYRNLLDSIEASTDTKNIDVQVLRQLRAMIDKEYTPEEIETLERTLWGKIRKAVLAGEPPDLTKFQNIQESLLEAQARLGEMDAKGRFYTLRQFAGDIKSLTTPLPDDMLTENYNFSDLVIFYKECEDSWEELYKIKSSPAKLRQEWRKNHVEEEAMLLFWGMYSQSVFTRGSPEWMDVSSLLGMWFDLHGIDKRQHSEWADWTLPTR